MIAALRACPDPNRAWHFLNVRADGFGASGSRLEPCAYGDPVPRIDGNYGHNDLGDVLCAEQRCRFCIGLLCKAPVVDQGYLFCDGQYGLLFCGEQVCLLPCVEQGNALDGLAIFEGILSVHVQAKGAAIDLGSPDLDELFVRLANLGGSQVGLQSVHGFKSLGLCLSYVYSVVHIALLFWRYKSETEHRGKA